MFAQRSLSSFILVAAFVAAVMLGNHGWLFFLAPLLSTAMVWVGMKEFLDLTAKRTGNGALWPGLILAPTLTVAVYALSYIQGTNIIHNCQSLSFTMLPICVLLLFGAELAVFKSGGQSALINFALSLAGLVYVSWLFSFTGRLLYFPNTDGRMLVLFLFLVSKADDIFAYLVGTAIGRIKVYPSISPNKTLEGSIGGLCGSMLAAWGGNVLILDNMFSNTTVLVLGFIIATSTQFGDLCESMIKRDAGVKDSGHMLPGIGGVLDLIDGVLFSAPAMYIFLILAVDK